MFLVLVMGAAVTNTGSAEGCGRSWPLCNGQLVPEFTVSAAIEYSHRGVTGVEGLLVAALSVGMVTLWRRDREAIVLAVVMFGTLLLQAGLGAGAVLFPQSPFMLATHFGVSLICFAATFLSAVYVYQRTAVVAVAPARVPSRQLKGWVVGLSLYVLCVVYLGAYIRHAEISLACADWPLCNGQIVPGLSGPTLFVFGHRLGAAALLVLLAWLVRIGARAGVGRRAAALAFGLAMLQALSGALVVWSRLGLFSTLAHAAIMALLFATLAHLLRLVLVPAAERNKNVGQLYSLSDEAARSLQPSVRASHLHALATGSGFGAATGRDAVADDSRGERTGGGAAQREPAAGIDPGSR
jgi:cytochrome c oxidase assembly protein subunit 15